MRRCRIKDNELDLSSHVLEGVFWLGHLFVHLKIQQLWTQTAQHASSSHADITPIS